MLWGERTITKGKIFMKMRDKKKWNRSVFLISMAVSISMLFQVLTGYAYETKTGIIKYDVVNVRSAAGTNQSIVTQLTEGTVVSITGEKDISDGYIWYTIPVTVSGTAKTGWVRSDCLTIQKDTATDATFEACLKAQGFPESYKVKLRELHKKYPNWQFVAKKTNLKWSDVLSAESTLGKNLVSGSSVSSWKSTQTGAYNWQTGTWVELDSGNWVAASVDMIAYCMDPRNFLDAESVFQFLSQKYDATTQTKSGLKTMVEGTFLEGNYTEGDTTKQYTSVIMNAGEKSGVSPYILASMILTEQGTKGTGNSISGTVSGYKGYYNFFNIGAYKTSTMTAVQRGLWFAKGSGTGATTYNRPWNTRKKSITGGALYYAEGYVNAGQDTLYLKKFNVQGSNLYNHQYMTNVQGAATEGRTLAKAFSESMRKQALTFMIPIYTGMPDSACACPTGDGSPNNMLKALKVQGYSLSPSFDMYTTAYSLIVPADVSSVKLTASAVDTKATVSGTGSITLNEGSNKKTVKVKAQNGDIRKYTVTIVREADKTGTPKVTSDKYTVDNTEKRISGITTFPVTVANFKKNFHVSNGTIALLNSNGKTLSGNVGTGAKLVLYDTKGNKKKTYQILLYGDTNGDGRINALDLLLVQKQILGLQKLTGIYSTAADTSRNGRADALDLLQVQKQIIGKGSIKQ